MTKEQAEKELRELAPIEEAAVQTCMSITKKRDTMLKMLADRIAEVCEQHRQDYATAAAVAYPLTQRRKELEAFLKLAP